MPFPLWLLLINAISTWFMVGLIWLVQVVHYPLFAHVGIDSFTEYHRKHTRRITGVVIAPMLLEAITSLWLLIESPAGIDRKLLWLGAALVLLIWLSTAFLQVPRHNNLSTGFDATHCKSLCAGNWFRTLAWSARGLLVALIFATLLSHASAHFD